MATRVIERLVDDIDHSTAGVDTYRFALQGVDYEIDLSNAHFDALCAALNPYITAGRRQPRKAGPARGSRAADVRPAAIRAWWAQNAVLQDLPPHRRNGPIPPAVTAAFHTAR
jgi:hypothetical protein